MSRNILFIIFLIGVQIHVYSQEMSFGKAFKLTDDKFKVGDYYRTNYVFEVGRGHLAESQNMRLDSVVDFMSKNPTLVIEVGQHRDSRGTEYYSTKITQQRAQHIVDYLIAHGIDPRRLMSVGYGESRLMVTDSTIKSMKTEEERERLHAKNWRTEFTILADDYKENQ